MYTTPIAYAVKHADSETRMNSRSGGIFTALSDYILSQGGVIYGCILTEDFKAVHVRATSVEERDQMRGSKYIQSNLGDTFLQVKQDLLNKLPVLFSGTSCQIAGLKGFLNKNYENLLCVDIICHGVGSPLIFEKYINWWETTTNKKCVDFNFRNKKAFGWSKHVETIYLQDSNNKIQTIHSRIYASIFQRHDMMRPSCYKCPFKSIRHPADITIADYWKIDDKHPGFNDDKGVSLVLVNNEKGSKYFEIVTPNLDYIESIPDKTTQRPLRSPYPQPETRDETWDNFYNMEFNEFIEMYTNPKDRIKKAPAKKKPVKSEAAATDTAKATTTATKPAEKASMFAKIKKLFS